MLGPIAHHRRTGQQSPTTHRQGRVSNGTDSRTGQLRPDHRGRDDDYRRCREVHRAQRPTLRPIWKFQRHRSWRRSGSHRHAEGRVPGPRPRYRAGTRVWHPGRVMDCNIQPDHHWWRRRCGLRRGAGEGQSAYPEQHGRIDQPRHQWILPQRYQYHVGQRPDRQRCAHPRHDRDGGNVSQGSHRHRTGEPERYASRHPHRQRHQRQQSRRRGHQPSPIRWAAGGD